MWFWGFLLGLSCGISIMVSVYECYEDNDISRPKKHKKKKKKK